MRSIKFGDLGQLRVAGYGVTGLNSQIPKESPRSTESAPSCVENALATE